MHKYGLYFLKNHNKQHTQQKADKINNKNYDKRRKKP